METLDELFENCHFNYNYNQYIIYWLEVEMNKKPRINVPVTLLQKSTWMIKYAIACIFTFFFFINNIANLIATP